MERKSFFSFSNRKTINNQDKVYIYLKKRDAIIGWNTLDLESMTSVKNPFWMKLGDSYVLISAIVYKKTQIPHYDNLIECETKKYECIIETYQGVFEKFGNYHIEYRINNIKYCTSIQKKDQYVTGGSKV